MDTYMVFNANGGQSPKVMHEGLEKAREEAKRLAEKEPKSNFYVLKVIESVRMSRNPFEIRVY